jgi:uncharacterized membrane protein YraQ (UPF0718 family)
MNLFRNMDPVPVKGDSRGSNKMTMLAVITGGIVVALTWWGLYQNLHAFSKFITYSIFKLRQGTHFGSALEFFFYDLPKVMMLLTLVVFGVGILRSFFSPEKTREMLAGKSEFAGNILAALLGIVTPFCSCSAVPWVLHFHFLLLRPWSMKWQ